MEIIILLVIATVLIYLYLQEQKRIKRQRWEEKQRWEEDRRKRELQREAEEQEAERLRQKKIANEKEKLRQQEVEQQRRVQQAKDAEREQEVVQRAKQEAEARREKEAERQIQVQAIERARIEKEESEKLKRQLLQLNLSSERKENYKDFAHILQENRISTLYHFTDRENIPSIKESGALLSWWYCEQNDIAILRPGSDEISKSLDRRYNLQDYVRLSFTPNHPMMYVAKSQGRIQNPVVLKINPEVCLFEETKFSNMNATKTGHNCGQTLEDLTKVKFAVVRQNTHFDLSDEDKPYYQAEVLVKTRLPIEWITNINAF